MCGVMRDLIITILMFFAVLLIALLLCHIAHSVDIGKNWFTTPLFGESAHNAGLINHAQTCESLLWIV